MVQFFDTRRRGKIEFEALEEGKVRIYSCGPTVYNYAHIGNFRAFLLADLLKRYLRYRGYAPLHIMNITDVEDKIIQRVRQEKEDLKTLTERYTQIFFDELAQLNVEKADNYPRATDHITEMVDLIERLQKKGLAYERDGSVYFSIAHFADYGKFAQLDTSGMQVGVRVDSDEYDKDDVRDFVLWKARSQEDGEVFWDSPFGQGRPGWHLECSCMSMKYLGESFDIHTGGVDLVFPHHQNEIAQSEGATGKTFVRYWLHNAFLNINDEKMSKSAGNFYRLQDIGKTPEDIRAFRYFLVVNHYRNPLNFTFESLENHKNALRRLERVHRRLGEASQEETAGDWAQAITAARQGFVQHMDDDLNTPAAMAPLFVELFNPVEKALNSGQIGGASAKAVLDFLDEINQVLGIFYAPVDQRAPKGDLSAELAALIDARQAARADKDWAKADQLRDELLAAGIEIKDTPQGAEWSWSE